MELWGDPTPQRLQKRPDWSEVARPWYPSVHCAQTLADRTPGQRALLGPGQADCVLSHHSKASGGPWRHTQVLGDVPIDEM